MPENKKIKIIGGGLAGMEASYFLLKEGFTVDLYEQRPIKSTGAHESEYLGELVCSNSLKSKELTNACGLLKKEIEILGSLMVEAANVSSIPGGNALTVDREVFAKYITDKLLSFPNFHLQREEVTSLDDELTIVCTGPLSSEGICKELESIIGSNFLSFFDASAPIVKKESIDFTKAYFKSRFSQDDDAYINCPFSREEYFTFVKELLGAKKAILREFDTKYFEGCLPIEVIASRGIETLRHGPLKPFGLEKDKLSKPYAVVQLRQDNVLGNYYNLVGFQTNLTYPEQKRVFSMIPGLENAEFVRYGLMHRNTFINSPSVLNEDLSLKNKPNVFIGGQLSGCEGYVESAAIGLLAAIFVKQRIEQKQLHAPSKNTILGSLLNYILHASPSSFTPMNANWALLSDTSKKNREESIKKSISDMESYKICL
ncbi:MAG: methylenetetrahydrofolate--tRNA-(uracil(54)-C(5))-methyltransferase (FADH(2)-oxidizing) TrmFO [Bacilli bacterium]|nr:methylenetetrahydrofolate--tRNA-(uracil(54)-C(5))-methyltransferase (FADH(2)-oxidizing) TrmFO [Bacilli bacterium]MDY6430401.1 methylenetetrahydrofolate--tRNA-(uracil(54)-C(5))-methyltransferase (FADH(2)-oxidizing) TrmFO [Bacilli bacterium]